MKLEKAFIESDKEILGLFDIRWLREKIIRTREGNILHYIK